MGKLAPLMANLERSSLPMPAQGQQFIEGLLGSLADDISVQLARVVGSDIEAQRRASEAVQVALYNLTPKLERALQEAIAEAGKGVRAEFNRLKDNLTALSEDVKKRAITQADMVRLQGDLVKALSNVKIPDYTQALERLEARKVDLQPLLEKLDNLVVELPDDDPREWTFDIKRDRDGLIESVTATAQD